MAHRRKKKPDQPGTWVPIETRTRINPRSGEVRRTRDGWPRTVWIRIT